MGMEYGQLIKTLVSNFLAHPENIEINVSGDPQRISIIMQVHRTDQSMVIGSSATMVKALTHLLKRAAEIRGENIWFEILEPQFGTKEFESPFQPDEKWTSDKDNKIADIMQAVGSSLFGGPFTVHVRGEWDRTMLFVSVELQQPVELIAALNVIFRAIGKGMGRKTVSINVSCAPSSKGPMDERGTVPDDGPRQHG